MKLLRNHPWGIKWWTRWETSRGSYFCTFGEFLGWSPPSMVSTVLHLFMAGLGVHDLSHCIRRSKTLVGDRNPVSSVVEFLMAALPFAARELDRTCSVFLQAPRKPVILHSCESPLVFVASAPFFHFLLWPLVRPCRVTALHTWLSLSWRLCSLSFWKTFLMSHWVVPAHAVVIWLPPVSLT